MAGFSYEAKDAKAKTKKGVIEADNARHARALLREKGLFPLRVKEAAESSQREGFNFTFGNPMRGSKLALFTRQLATLVDSAMPIDEALATVAAQSEGNATKQLILQVRSKLVEGHTLASALAQFPNSFDTLYRSLVRAGEASGLLGEVLEELAVHLEDNLDTQQKVMGALAYPIILLVLSVGIVTYLMTAVVPEIVSVFDRSGQALPKLTEVVIAMSDYLLNYGAITGVVLLISAVGLARWLKTDAVRPSWHQFILRIPIAGTLVRTLEASRYASTLSILVGAGVNLIDALRICTEVLGNEVMKSANQAVVEKVTSGSSLFKALDDSKQFPLLLVHMVGSGERSGELAQMLKRASIHQSRELNGKIQTAVTVLEPLMILIMGAFVLVIVLAVLMPMLEMNNMVKL